MGFIALRAHLIFQFSEHVLFVYIDVKQNKTKIPDFIKNLLKVKFCWRQIWANLIIHKPSLGSRKVPQNLDLIGAAILTLIGYKRAER